MSGSAPPGPPRSNCRRSRSLASIRRLLVLILVVAGLGVAGWALTPAVDDLDARVRAVQPAATYTPIAAIPRRLQVATVAIEDERFFQHHGVDSQGVVRALWNNLRSGHLNEGASTITQQLAKRTYLQGDDRSWRRKADEVILAVKMERQYGKAQILEYYLNDIYYGRGATGIGPAARRYFGVAPIELTLAQAALLAGLPQAPSALDPYSNFAGAKARQRAVLAQMARDGYLSTEQADSAAAEPLRLR